jgi:DNA-binding MarR family transcriptional regulator
MSPPRSAGRTAPPELTDDDYAQLLALRDELRRFLRWSEQEARAAGLTPARHQLLLAVRGHHGDPTVGEIAEHLLVRHHSVVELIDRAQQADLVERIVDPDDHRVVRIRLTPAGESTLAALSATHLDQLASLRAALLPHGSPAPR